MNSLTELDDALRIRLCENLYDLQVELDDLAYEIEMRQQRTMAVLRLIRETRVQLAQLAAAA